MRLGDLPPVSFHGDIDHTDIGSVAMIEAVRELWTLKLQNVKRALEENRFEAYIAENTEEAHRIVFENIVPPLGSGVVSWGGSVTVGECHVAKWFHESPDWEVISINEKGISAAEKFRRRRQALTSDLYFLSANAVYRGRRFG